MDLDRNGFEVLDREECLRLLGTATIGRVGLCTGALPTVLPVNVVVAGDGAVVFRTRRGAKLDAATADTVIAVEVDDIDTATHEGWSVVVTGVASEITDPDELASARALPIAYWGPLPADRYVRVTPDLVSGRRIVATLPVQSAG